MKKIIHKEGSINTKPKEQRVAIVKNALDNLRALSPSAEAFVNLDPYINISRKR